MRADSGNAHSDYYALYPQDYLTGEIYKVLKPPKPLMQKQDPDVSVVLASFRSPTEHKTLPPQPVPPEDEEQADLNAYLA